MKPDRKVKPQEVSMTREIMKKIEVGDGLTDEELLTAIEHFNRLVKDLLVLGPQFHLAFAEVNRRLIQLTGYARYRGLM